MVSADFFRFQLTEIEQAELSEGEEEALEEEARRLEHAEELALGTQGLHEALYGGEESLSDRASSLQLLLEQLSKLDPTLQEPAQSLRDAYHLLVETGQTTGTLRVRPGVRPGTTRRGPGETGPRLSPETKIRAWACRECSPRPRRPGRNSRSWTAHPSTSGAWRRRCSGFRGSSSMRSRSWER